MSKNKIIEFILKKNIVKELDSETHLFIIWEKARKNKDKIFEQIKKKFKIYEVYEISWNSSDFIRNLKKFYGVTLPDPERKIRQCGNGSFLLLIVRDENPKHGIRKTSLGKQLVNINMYDSKREYRKIVGGDFPIHGTIHQKEVNHDLALILGKNLKQIESELKAQWDGSIKKIEKNLVGLNGWNDLKQLFFVLNNTINYVVLRNFEDLPEKEMDERHDDIDILTDELWQIPYILGKNIPGNKNKKFPFVKIGEKYIKFDIKYVGDTYLDEKWSRDILKRRKLTSKGVYSPSEEDYFYTLLHHIIIQKTKITDDYKEKLNSLAKSLNIEKFNEKITDLVFLKAILDKYMKKHEYRYTNSFEYKIGHNEILRLSNVAVKVMRTDGIGELLRATKGKLRRTRSK